MKTKKPAGRLFDACSGFFIALFLYLGTGSAAAVTSDAFRWLSGKGLYKFSNKNAEKPYKVSGSLSLIRPWQSPENLIEHLASSSELKEITTNLPAELKGKLYQGKTKSGITMACGYSFLTRNEYKVMHDFCLTGDLSSLPQHLHKVAHIQIPADFYSPEKITNKQTLPSGFFKIAEKNEQKWFLDTSGLIELEYSTENAGPVRISRSGVRIFRESMNKVLAKKYQLQYKPGKADKTLPVKQPVCWQYTGDDRNAVFCLRDLPGQSLGSGAKPAFYERKSLLAVYPVKDIDGTKLKEDLLQTMKDW